METLRISIAGNPNCGKTTLFNALTGSRQHVGNWPGVTVERMAGYYEEGDTRIDVTDLPGIYSMSAHSIDESIARQHILTDSPDLVVNIVDASNLERNLYLTAQLIEMHAPVIVALNMMDVARKRSIRIETEHLARHLGCPVIPIVAKKGTGVEELREAILDAAREKRTPEATVAYDSELEKALVVLQEKVQPLAERNGVDARWLAVKTFERDELALQMVENTGIDSVVAAETSRVEKHTGEDIDIVISDGRYGFIHGLARDVVHRDNQIRRTVSDAIDRVVLSRAVGIPMFLVVMYFVFLVTIKLSGPFIDLFDHVCGIVFVDGTRGFLAALSTPEWLTSLAADGVGGGVQAVSTFIPPIFFIFLCLSFLEDSGYMARAAFVMDRLLRTIGLPGKAFLPMLVGFGCNVPAIMATRTLDNSRDRIQTIMMNPFMSCGARLPVYTLFVAAFFPRHGGSILFGLYLAGVVLAVLTGLLMEKTILHGETSSLVMELPPYHMPTFRGIMYHTWHRLKSFILRAGQVVIVAVIILSFLSSIGTDGSFGNEDSSQSVLSAVSRKVGIVFRPMGLTEENWPGAVGMVAGLFAKEAVVGTLDALYTEMAASDSAGADEIVDTESAIARYFDGKAGAIAYLLFILIYCPCVAAVAAIYNETNLKWTAFIVGYLTLLAWVVSTSYYQVATFSRHPASSAGWLSVCLGSLFLLYGGLRARARTMTVEA